MNSRCIAQHTRQSPECLFQPDQFAYKEGLNTSLALIKSQHMWLKWLDTREADCVKVFAFDFSKAFDFVNHFILFNKFKELSVNSYIVN